MLNPVIKRGGGRKKKKQLGKTKPGDTSFVITNYLLLDQLRDAGTKKPHSSWSHTGVHLSL